MHVGKCVCIVYECTCLAWLGLVSFPDLRSPTEEPGNEGIKFSWQGEEEFL